MWKIFYKPKLSLANTISLLETDSPTSNQNITVTQAKKHGYILGEAPDPF